MLLSAPLVVLKLGLALRLVIPLLLVVACLSVPTSIPLRVELPRRYLIVAPKSLALLNVVVAHAAP